MLLYYQTKNKNCTLKTNKMKQKIIFAVFTMLNLLTATICVKAQTTNDLPPPTPASTDFSKVVNDNDNVYNIAIIKQPPTYPGGEVALFKYLGNNIKYPAIARESGIEGTVYVEFIIDKDGSVTNVVAKRKVDGGCTEEALRVINAMPNWIPGIQEGKPVKVKYTLPIKFKLQDNDVTSTNTTASFTGGEVALSEYIANNLKYPKKARKKKIEGTVVVNFIVTMNGKIQGATIIQSLNKDCDAEALRLVNAMPKWTPAIKNGIPAMSIHSLPIQFKL